MKNPTIDDMFGEGWAKRMLESTYEDKKPPKAPHCPKCGKEMKPTKESNYSWECLCLQGKVLC